MTKEKSQHTNKQANKQTSRIILVDLDTHNRRFVNTEILLFWYTDKGMLNVLCTMCKSLEHILCAVTLILFKLFGTLGRLNASSPSQCEQQQQQQTHTRLMIITATLAGDI